ncbi:MAG: sugar transferase [Bacteroidales bacterium]|nr:sugar transferase [Bacteroidales bacterium]
MAHSTVSKLDFRSRIDQITKRSFDVVLSSILLVVFSPLAAIIALAIYIEDGQSVLYKQERVGLYGESFNILKFRSMKMDAEAYGAQLFSGDSDPRLTKVGRFIRAHHLDELPQIYNVFRGDMSFVGYRPERPFYISKIMRENPRYRYLYQIRPGVTSYATLYNGYTDTMEKMLKRLDLDLYYLRHHSVAFDMKVLGLTFLSIVSGKKF